MPQSDMNNYGSESDQQAANSALSNLRNIVGDSDLHVLDMIVSRLSTLIDVSSCTKHCLLSSISMSVLMYAKIKGLLKANMTALTIPFFFFTSSAGEGCFSQTTCRNFLVRRCTFVWIRTSGGLD